MVKAVFIHIPKTAGSSFRNMLELGFGADGVSPAFNASRMTDSDADRLRRYEIVAGHISSDDIKRYFPEALLLTVVRNPIDRCISWYYFARKMHDHADNDVRSANEHEVEAFFDLATDVLFKNIYNRHTRQFGDHVSNIVPDWPRAYECAQDTLRSCCWIGRQETLADDIRGLIKIFPELSGVPLPTVNVTQGRKTLDDIPDRTLAAIRSLNEWDSSLLEALY